MPTISVCVAALKGFLHFKMAFFKESFDIFKISKNLGIVMQSLLKCKNEGKLIKNLASDHLSKVHHSKNMQLNKQTVKVMEITI